MSDTKKCPDCDLPIKANAASCACGWRSVPKASTSAKSEAADAEPWRCTHELLGQRCSEAGTHRRGDRWVCGAHSGRGRAGAEAFASMTAVREAIAKCRQVVAQAKPIVRVGAARPIGEVAKETLEQSEPWPEGRE